MASNDTELFELCKQVYEATGWKGTDCVWYSNAGEVHDKRSVWVTDEVFDKPANVPLYTSDYLLEKLPVTLPKIDNRSRDIIMDTGYIKGDFVYRFGYDSGFDASHTIEAFGSTPLKALLKLSLALKEAKLL